MEEVRDVIEIMNSEKSPGKDGVKVEMLKAGKEAVAEWCLGGDG